MPVSERDLDLINRIRYVEGELSPENLTCDGELPYRQVVAKRNKLVAMRKKLVKALGWEPSIKEVWGL